jgi:hypothetical protein
MSISENYEGSVTLIHSDISTFSRGTTAELPLQSSEPGHGVEMTVAAQKRKGVLTTERRNPNIVGWNRPLQIRAKRSVRDGGPFVDIEDSKFREVFGQPFFVVVPIAGVRNAVPVFAQDNNGNGDLSGFAEDGFQRPFAICHG